jgi:exonuclease VII large subunit
MNESEPHAPDPMELSKKRSRTISNLTEEQIRHKRDVDRRAQRASRQRTKDCIARLEQQYLQLQETSRETEAQLRQEIQALHAQNQSLLRCLDSIVDLASTVTREHSSGSVVNDGAGMTICSITSRPY